MQDFASAAAQFTYPEGARVEEETLRQQFLERFPASGLNAMTVEQYCLGLEPKENSFCYWLEYKTRSLGGIGGGNANKHVIYYDKELKQYIFNDRYKTQEQAFSTVKSGLLELLRLAEEDMLDQSDIVPRFENMTLIRGKVLNMYFPDKFLPICILDHLNDFCF